MRKRLEDRLDKFAKLEASYKKLMAMTDAELRIYNANARGVLFADPVYRECQDYDVLLKMDERALTESEYAKQLFPSFGQYTDEAQTTIPNEKGACYAAGVANGQKPTYAQTNGNGNHVAHNGNSNRSFRGLPPGFGIALGGDILPIEQLVEANRSFIQNTRMR